MHELVTAHATKHDENEDVVLCTRLEGPVETGRSSRPEDLRNVPSYTKEPRVNSGVKEMYDQKKVRYWSPWFGQAKRFLMKQPGTSSPRLQRRLVLHTSTVETLEKAVHEVAGCFLL